MSEKTQLTTFNKIIEVVLQHEGGYVNDSNDLGGEPSNAVIIRRSPWSPSDRTISITLSANSLGGNLVANSPFPSDKVDSTGILRSRLKYSTPATAPIIRFTGFVPILKKALYFQLVVCTNHTTHAVVSAVAPFRPLIALRV